MTMNKIMIMISSIYKYFIEYADKMLLTLVDSFYEDFDTYFTDFDELAWQQVEIKASSYKDLEYR